MSSWSELTMLSNLHMDLKRLKQVYVDSDINVLVSGYARMIQMEIKLNLNDEYKFFSENIPPMINSLCILYYYQPEYFDIIGKEIKVSKDKMSISSTINVKKNTSYGSHHILSTEKQTVRWSVKINETSTSKFVIGISSTNKCDESFCKCREAPYVSVGPYSHHIGYVGHNGKCVSVKGKRKYGEPLAKHDIIDIKFDLINKRVVFYKNGQSQGFAFYPVVTGNNIKYRLSIQLLDENTTVSIVKFKREFHE
eukprot:348798_1